MTSRSKAIVFINSNDSTRSQAQVSVVRSYTANHTWERRRRLRDERLGRPSLKHLLSSQTTTSASTQSEETASPDVVALRTFKGNSDPFSVAALDITPVTNELLSLSHHWPLFHDYPIWATSLYEEHVRLAQADLMRDILSDAAMLHCLLAAGYYVKSQNNEAASMAALAHKTRVLEIMQTRISMGQDVSPLVDYLVPMESFVGNFKAAETHWQALKHILTSTHPEFRSKLLPHLWVQDVWLAYYADRKTILDIDEWDKPMPQFDQYLEDSISDERCDVGPADPYLLNMITDVRRFLSLRDTALTLPDTLIRGELVRWLHLHNAAIDGRLLDYMIDLGDVESTGNTHQALNASVALAIMTFMHLIWFDHPFGQVQPVNHLRFDGLLRLGCHEADQDLLIWLYFMCAMNDTLLPEPTGWAKERFGSLRLDYKNWGEMQSVLEKFLYLEDMEKRLVTSRATVKALPKGVHFLYQKMWLAEWNVEWKKTCIEEQPG